MTSLEWFSRSRDWVYAIRPEGHLFRWTAVYREGTPAENRVDLGLVPGGIYVAVEELLEDGFDDARGRS